MKSLRILAVCAVVVAFFAIDAEAQKRTKRASTRKTTSSSARTIPPLEVRAARQKVDVQLSNVNDFLIKLGPLAANLETAIADQEAGKLRPSTSARIDRARADLVTSIRDIGTALNTLESEFRTKPSLSKYLMTIQGIFDLASESQDLAIAGDFVQAKEPLREVAKKLTDVRAMIPMSAR